MALATAIELKNLDKKKEQLRLIEEEAIEKEIEHVLSQVHELEYRMINFSSSGGGLKFQVRLKHWDLLPESEYEFSSGFYKTLKEAKACFKQMSQEAIRLHIEDGYERISLPTISKEEEIHKEILLNFYINQAWQLTIKNQGERLTISLIDEHIVLFPKEYHKFLKNITGDDLEEATQVLLDSLECIFIGMINSDQKIPTLPINASEPFNNNAYLVNMKLTINQLKDNFLKKSIEKTLLIDDIQGLLQIVKKHSRHLDLADKIDDYFKDINYGPANNFYYCDCYTI